MKTPEQWMRELSGIGTEHAPDCCCDRCNHGVETFLLPSDIKDIQSDARNHALREAAEVRDELLGTPPIVENAEWSKGYIKACYDYNKALLALQTSDQKGEGK